MTTKAAIDDFLALSSLAVAGASRKGRKFGNMAYRKLKEQGYRVVPVHPQAEKIEGDPCYPDLNALPEPVDGLFISLPPKETGKVVREAAEAGIRRVWIQQGAASKDTIEYCEEQGISVVSGQCILMFVEPTGIHRFHRWLWRLLGKLPSQIDIVT